MPTALERAGDFSQSVDASGNPFPYIRDFTTGLPCSASNTSGCFQAGGVLGRIPANRIYGPGLAALDIYPTANFSGGSGLNFTSQDPNSSPRGEQLLRMDFQATNNWRITGRYMKNTEDILQAYGTTWAGNGSDHLPMPVLFVHPGSNYMLSGTGILNSTTTLELSWGRAANSLNYQLQNPDLFRAAAGLSAMPLIYPTAVQADYIPDFRFRGGRTDNAGFYQTDRGPFTNENITHDVIANMTKVWGAHASKAGFYFQHSFKPQSIFASFNSQIDFTDDASNPFDTGYSYANAATGVFKTYTQASKYALPEWRYKNWEFYAQDNWKPTSRLTLDYGVRFYYLTPQWDTTLQASNFLPDEFNPSAAAQLYTPVCVGGDPVRGLRPARHGSGAHRRRACPPSLANTRRGPLHRPAHSRFEPVQRLLSGRSGHQRRIAGRVRLQGLTSRGRRLRPDGERHEHPPRRLGDFLRSAAGQHGVRHDRERPGRAELAGSVGPAADAGDGRRRSRSDAGPQSNRLRLQAPEGDAVERGLPAQGVERSHPGYRLRGLQFDRPAAAGRISTRFRLVRRWRHRTRIPPAPRQRSWGPSALPNDFLRPYRGYSGIRMWDYSGYGNYNSLQTSVTRRFDGGFMFSGFFVWSKALGINNDDFSPGVPNLSEEETRALDYSYLDYDRPFNFVFNFIYQTPQVTTSKMLGILANEWQISGAYRWTSGRPYGVGFNIPDINSLNLTGTDTPNARIVLTCDPGSGWSGDPYRQLNTDVLRSAAARQQRQRIGAVLRARAAHQQHRSVDLQEHRRGEDGQVRDTPRHVQLPEPHAVHGCERDRQLRQLDGSEDHEPAVRCQRRARASKRRVRDHHQRRSSAHVAARHPRDVLARVIAAI